MQILLCTFTKIFLVKTILKEPDGKCLIVKVADSTPSLPLLAGSSQNSRDGLGKIYNGEMRHVFERNCFQETEQQYFIVEGAELNPSFNKWVVLGTLGTGL